MYQMITAQNTEGSLSLNREVRCLTQWDQLAAKMEVVGNPEVQVYGQCDECPCPAFAGQGTYCERTSCRHHWKSHKRE